MEQYQQQNLQDSYQPQVPKKKDSVISAITKDRAEAAKAYIESNDLLKERLGKENWGELFKKMADMQFTPHEQTIVKRDVLQKESENLRRMQKDFFFLLKEAVKLISYFSKGGRGAFGEVRVCRDKSNNEIVAIKKMNKIDMSEKIQIGHIRAERDVLSSSGNPWIVQMKQSFQDDKYLYLVMEYLVGGDLMNLLIKKDIFTEDQSRFYIAELILAIESVHKMGYIHRDLKPDNILITSEGHVKLSDFGLCKSAEIKPKIQFGKKELVDDQKIDPKLVLTKRPANFERNRKLALSMVGTPDYIAPDVLLQKGYTETVDWWSLGVILFEMVVGYPPFYSNEPQTTCQKIIEWRNTFQIPKEANLQTATIDLIKKLIADPNERLGVNGVSEIKFHPFFAGVDWKNIRNKTPPFVPEVKKADDVSNFDKFDENTKWEDGKTLKNIKLDRGFFGYEFNRDASELANPVQNAIQNLETTYRSLSPRPLKVNIIYQFSLSKSNVISPSTFSQQPSLQQNKIILNRFQHRYESPFQGNGGFSPRESSKGIISSIHNNSGLNRENNQSILNQSNFGSEENVKAYPTKFACFHQNQQLIQPRSISPISTKNRHNSPLNILKQKVAQISSQNAAAAAVSQYTISPLHSSSNGGLSPRNPISTNQLKPNRNGIIGNIFAAGKSNSPKPHATNPGLISPYGNVLVSSNSISSNSPLHSINLKKNGNLPTVNGTITSQSQSKNISVPKQYGYNFLATKTLTHTQGSLRGGSPTHKNNYLISK